MKDYEVVDVKGHPILYLEVNDLYARIEIDSGKFDIVLYNDEGDDCEISNLVSNMDLIECFPDIINLYDEMADWSPPEPDYEQIEYERDQARLEDVERMIY